MKPTSVRYCLNGCTIRSGTTKIRAQADAPAVICNRCDDNLTRWLKTIPDNYALLPTFIQPGSIEKNPESKATKAAYVGTPVRLEVVDLLDQRHGLKWNGTTAAHDRRGALGSLMVHVDQLVAHRPLSTGLATPSVSGACSLLARHRLWITEQDWVTYLYADLKQLDRELSDAVGDYRRPPVGRCHVVPEETKDDKPCGGGLYASTYGGVHCPRCGATWDAGHLRQLGLAQAEAQEAAGA